MWQLIVFFYCESNSNEWPKLGLFLSNKKYFKYFLGGYIL